MRVRCFGAEARCVAVVEAGSSAPGRGGCSSESGEGRRTGPVEEGSSPGTEPGAHRRIGADGVPSTAAGVVEVLVVLDSSWRGHHSTRHHNHHSLGCPRSANRCIC